MIRIYNMDVWGFEHAVRGMRNPMNSWDKSDSEWRVYTPEYSHLSEAKYVIGQNDLNLMRKLYKAGSEHRKYLRQIFVSLDIIAPLYWWKEFDTYKVGTVANSCSTMHKIQAKEFELSDFSCEHLSGVYENCLEDTIDTLNLAREAYLSTEDKRYWWQMIQLLPSSYNQRRTITLNYENVISMICQRSNHKLDEWKKFVSVLYDLPYIEDIINGTKAE